MQEPLSVEREGKLLQELKIALKSRRQKIYAPLLEELTGHKELKALVKRYKFKEAVDILEKEMNWQKERQIYASFEIGGIRMFFLDKKQILILSW